ncbi:lasso peptide biosynthesis PqqD family chaperone [Kocuria marina]|uniref:lasso peptide biosynthesis PqqD family chaperone n=1 Tax=Kocuria marina TaxID=223184 RepID=UPI0011AB0454|nr:lasso peptide biosynthesis PqqD family chaperone [Kocuria indica]
MKNQSASTNGSLHRVPTEYGEVVLNDKTGAYWHLNESASRIVSVLETGGSTEDAVRNLVDAYGIDEAVVRRDIQAVASNLKKLGAL